jgi:hypothetical protein
MTKDEKRKLREMYDESLTLETALEKLDLTCDGEDEARELWDKWENEDLG